MRVHGKNHTFQRRTARSRLSSAVVAPEGLGSDGRDERVDLSALRDSAELDIKSKRLAEIHGCQPKNARGDLPAILLTPEEPTTEKAERHYQKNYDVVRVVFDEDFAIGEGIQQGLATGANQHFTFGRYECGLHLGQRSIDAALAGELRL